jgi:hypothetical protein
MKAACFLASVLPVPHETVGANLSTKSKKNRFMIAQQAWTVLFQETLSEATLTAPQ